MGNWKQPTGPEPPPCTPRHIAWLIPFSLWCSPRYELTSPVSTHFWPSHWSVGFDFNIHDVKYLILNCLSLIDLLEREWKITPSSHVAILTVLYYPHFSPSHHDVLLAVSYSVVDSLYCELHKKPIASCSAPLFWCLNYISYVLPKPLSYVRI